MGFADFDKKGDITHIYKLSNDFRQKLFGVISSYILKNIFFNNHFPYSDRVAQPKDDRH